MHFSLQAKILALVAGTATGLATVILLSLSWYANREINRSVRQDVREAGQVLTQVFHVQLAALDSQCRLPQNRSVLKAVISTNDPATVAYSAHDYQRQLGVDVVIITDRDGRILGASDGEAPQQVDLGREPGISSALDDHSWQGVIARRGQLMLSVSVPIKIAQYVCGTLTAYKKINPDVAGLLHSAIGTEIAFVHQGQIVGASLPLTGEMPTPQATPQLITLRSKRYFALYSPLAGTRTEDKTGFVTLRPYEQAMGLYNSFRLGLVSITVVTLLLALCGGTLLARNLTRPLSGVVGAAQILKRGEWPDQFAVKRQDEIGLLQSVFNEMTTTLRDGQERLLALIDTDPLTNLDNHRRFHERLAQEAAQAEKSGEALSLILFDLDHFHQYNQRLGHASGDLALQQVTEILRDCLPADVILARYAGEKFAALLPQHTLGQAEAMAEQVRASVFDLRGKQEEASGLSLSAGCAEFGTNSAQAEGLLLAAELAVSRAKQLGRNRVCRFDSVPGADQTADPYQLHRFMKDESLVTIQALAAAVDAKDPYTQGHSQRVAEYAAALGRCLGMSEADIQSVYITGTLHDVGKIGVPDAVLKKPGHLNNEEREIIETHPGLGEMIVRKVPALAYTLPGVRHHHERWDGNGYPDRLSGEAIPYVGRILALTDTFDAMTSDRPYRKGMSWDVALAEIERNAGTQFDPTLAPVFVTMMRDQSYLAKAA